MFLAYDKKTRFGTVCTIIVLSAVLSSCSLFGVEENSSGEPVPTQSSEEEDNITPVPRPTVLVSKWKDAKVSSLSLQVPQSWRKTIVPGSEEGYSLPSGAAVGLSRMTSPPTKVSNTLLDNIIQTTENTTGLKVAEKDLASEQLGFVSFDGSTNIYTWVVVAGEDKNFVVSLGLPYEKPKKAALSAPNADDVNLVETMVRKNIE